MTNHYKIPAPFTDTVMCDICKKARTSGKHEKCSRKRQGMYAEKNHRRAQVNEMIKP